ncbi:MAG: hypothetical protein V1798_03040 [Pseudomonadota bacterium]
MRFPFAKLRLRSRHSERIESVYADPEIGMEGFTYRLSSGRMDTVPLDAVLEYNRDPNYLRRMLLYRLTIMGQKALKGSGITKRELTRRLKTSPSQIYRLLDTANAQKSLDEMVRLLACLNVELDIVALKAA